MMETIALFEENGNIVLHCQVGSHQGKEHLEQKPDQSYKNCYQHSVYVPAHQQKGRLLFL